MSGPTRIDLNTATPTQASAIAPALSWFCPVCGKLRIFEGGRPAHQEECQKCGSPLFVPQTPAPQIRSSSLAW
jgi:uncharacterized protein (DUF983 family)